MAGVQKACRTCKAFFMTRSTRSARWENQCFECHQKHKKTKQMVTFQEREQNIVQNLENRIVKTEDWMNNLPSIIGAEVSNVMSSIIDDELITTITEKNDEKIALALEGLVTQMKQFEDKIQKQVSMLNTRIVKIMKEMEE